MEWDLGKVVLVLELLALYFSASLSMHIALVALSSCSPRPMRQRWSSCFYLYHIFPGILFPLMTS